MAFARLTCWLIASAFFVSSGYVWEWGTWSVVWRFALALVATWLTIIFRGVNHSRLREGEGGKVVDVTHTGVTVQVLRVGNEYVSIRREKYGTDLYPKIGDTLSLDLDGNYYLRRR